MLNEAVLNVAADLPTAKPFELNTLRWDLTMPTTVIPGVVPVLELSVGANGRVDGLSAVGSQPAKQRSATTYALSIIAPKSLPVAGVAHHRRRPFRSAAVRA